jgi:hypothetical protein
VEDGTMPKRATACAAPAAIRIFLFRSSYKLIDGVSMAYAFFS